MQYNAAVLNWLLTKEALCDSELTCTVLAVLEPSSITIMYKIWIHT